MYFPAEISSGLLAASGVRPLISSTIITLDGYSIADYDFGVQAIDGANLGGAFTFYNNTSVPERNEMAVSVVGLENNIRITNKQTGQVNYTILNVTGQTLSKGVCNSNEQIDISIAKKGIYLVQLSDRHVTKLSKISVF